VLLPQQPAAAIRQLLSWVAEAAAELMQRHACMATVSNSIYTSAKLMQHLSVMCEFVLRQRWWLEWFLVICGLVNFYAVEYNAIIGCFGKRLGVLQFNQE